MSKRAFAIARAVAAIGGTVAIVSGATLAQLTSSASLTANTLSSATADLQVQSDAGLGPTANGFAFSDLLPGATYGTEHLFNLKNNGTAPLTITVASTAGAASGGLVDKSKVFVRFTNVTDGNQQAEYTLQQLETNFQGVPFAPLTMNGSITKAFTVAARLDSTVTTSGAIGSFDLIFTGTQP